MRCLRNSPARREIGQCSEIYDDIMAYLMMADPDKVSVFALFIEVLQSGRGPKIGNRGHFGRRCQLS